MRPAAMLSATVLSAAVAIASAAAAEPTPAPLDRNLVIGGIDVACTGIGQTKDDPRWRAYNVRVEFADAHAAYLAGEDLTLSDAHGQALLSVSCEGPWVLLKLPARQSFSVQARVTEPDVEPRTARITPPSHGQARFVLTFMDAH